MAEKIADTERSVSPTAIRARTGVEAINDMLQSLLQSVADQPLGQISDVLGMSNLQGVLDQEATPPGFLFGEAAKPGRRLLTASDVAKFARELETGRGGLAEMANRVPKLRQFSQAALRREVGDTFTPFRAVSLPGEAVLRPDQMVSTTLSPGVARRMLQDAPALMTEDRFITARPQLIRFPDLPTDRAQAFVPPIIDRIKAENPATVLRQQVNTRRGGRMSIGDIFDDVRPEREVVADVTGHTREVLPLDRGSLLSDREHLAILGEVGSGIWAGPEEYLRRRPGLFFGEHRDAALQALDDFAVIAGQFTGKTVQPTAIVPRGPQRPLVPPSLPK
jgi:hypothetical protein